MLKEWRDRTIFDVACKHVIVCARDMGTPNTYHVKLILFVLKSDSHGDWWLGSSRGLGKLHPKSRENHDTGFTTHPLF